MTRDKDFKSVVRARMSRTGESYTTARQAVLSGPPPQAQRNSDAVRQQRLLVDRWFVDGRLRAIPARRKVRAGVMLEILTRFVPGRTYTEREVSRNLGRGT